MFKFLIGFRKFTIILLLTILLTVFLVTGDVPGPDYAKAIASLGTAFCATNVGEHLIEMGKEYFKKDKE
jgi:hypothetical protein